jgi:methylmalonyl-CoA epimerase
MRRTTNRGEAHVLTNLLNIGVAVNDIEAAIHQYQDVFGATIVRPLETNHALKIRLAILRIGDAEIELFSPLAGETQLRRFLDTRGEGLYRLAFKTADMDAELAHFDGKGVRYAEAQGDGDSRIAFLSPKAANGVMFELVQRPEDQA